MKLSMLIPTKNRGSFADWCAWNLVKQTRQPDEVIIVESSGDEDYGKLFDALNRAYQHKGIAAPLVHELKVPEETTTGAAREVALQAATGDVITWMDDDDWHHPRRLEVSIEPFEREESGKVLVSYVPTRTRLNLKTLRTIDVKESGDHIYIPFSMYERELAQSVSFRDINSGEDHWYFFDKEGGLWTKLEDPWFMDPRIVPITSLDLACIVVIHGLNTWNRDDLAAYDFYKTHYSARLPKTAPRGVEADEWNETWAQIMDLRARLYGEEAI